MGWAEAGVAVSYLRRTDQTNLMRPDYRGGVSFSRARGSLLGAETPGWFYENHGGGVFGSRFNNTLLFWRADLTHRLQQDWIAEMERIRGQAAPRARAHTRG